MQKIGIVDKAWLALILTRMLVEPHLLKAARFMLSLSQDDLAKEAKLSIRTIHKLEAGGRGLSLSSLEAVRRVLEARGIVFLGKTESMGPGFRVTHAISDSWQYVPPESDPPG
ncbi:helix-turn-helix transcriptional regulator [Aureimonas pseudogalii]|uniref:helix-turn-helix transcriptional regulator n=2 Tax=Aureimonas pseudogalii TaxID=1744844 RepID=UPI0035E448F3